MTVWTVAIGVVLGLVIFAFLPHLLMVGIVAAVIAVLAVVLAILGWMVGLLPEVIVAIAWSYGIMLIWIIVAVFAARRLAWIAKTKPRLRDVEAGAALCLSTLGGLVAGGMAAVPLDGDLDPSIEPFILIAMATPVIGGLLLVSTTLAVCTYVFVLGRRNSTPTDW